MNLNQLRFVSAVAEAGSFSRAAKRCCVTQPTLSNGVSQLEEELGGRIFERTTRKVVLTPFGKHVLPLVVRVLEARAELEKGANAYLNPEYKISRIGLSPLIDTRLLSTVLEPFRQVNRDVETFFKECSLHDLDRRLVDESIDIVLRPKLSDWPQTLNEERVLFYEDPLYYFPRNTRDDGGNAQGPVALESVAHETYVLTGDVCGLAAATRELFAARGLELREYPGRALGYQVLQGWTELGIAAAIVPLSKVLLENRGRARPLLLDLGEPAKVCYEAIWRKNAAYADHICQLHDHFRNTVPTLIKGSYT